MLLALTYKCSMCCTHCLADANPYKSEMPMGVLLNAIELINKLGVKSLLITGGEPTEHPEFFKFISKIIDVYKEIILVVLSNGSFVNDNEKLREVIELLDSSVRLRIQITTDERFYPDHKKTVHSKELLEFIANYHKKVYFVDRLIDKISPYGRALKNHKDLIDRSRVPSCTNLYLIARQVRTMREIIKYLELKGKFCTPLITPNGTVLAGEAYSCSAIGTVKSEPEEIYNNLKQGFCCNNCGQSRNIVNKFLNQNKDLIKDFLV